MGYYINENSKGEPLPAKGKIEALMNDGAILAPSGFQENLVCVVENAMFDAAGYMYSEREYEYFRGTSQKKTWLLYSHAKDLAK